MWGELIHFDSTAVKPIYVLCSGTLIRTLFIWQVHVYNTYGKEHMIEKDIQAQLRD